MTGSGANPHNRRASLIATALRTPSTSLLTVTPAACAEKNFVSSAATAPRSCVIDVAATEAR